MKVYITFAATQYRRSFKHFILTISESMANAVDLKIFNPYKVNGLKRVGNSNDGGYVIHAPSLEHVDCLMNYGVGYNVEFEKQFNKLTGVPVYAFDPTMKKAKYFIE